MKTYRVGYKVLTSTMESLGLKKNPNILRFPVGRWFSLPPGHVVSGGADYGGIWLARTPPQARSLAKYVRRKHGMDTKIFRALVGHILYMSSCRVKTDKIFLVDEVAGLGSKHGGVE